MLIDWLERLNNHLTKKELIIKMAEDNKHRRNRIYQKGKEEERERILKIIPKTWLDHLLEPYLNKKEFTPKDIENILMMIREEIKQSSDNLKQ